MAQLQARRCRLIGCDRQIGDQATIVGRVLARHDRGLAHRGVPRERLLDLARLDPEAANLDLAIHPAEVLEVAVGPPAGEVARAVEASARLRAERVGDETLGRQPGLFRYPRATPAPPMYSSPATPTGTGSRFRFSDVQSCVGDRPPDRDGARDGLVARHAVDATADDRLGRPVLVDQRGLGACCRQKATCSGRQLLAADDEGSRPARGIAGIHLIAEPAEMSRRDLDQAVVARSPECLAQLLDAQVFVEQVDAPARDQRGEQGGDRQVERDRRMDRRSLPLRDGIGLRAPAQVVRQAQVVDHGPFGPAGRARGVDDIGEVLEPRAAGEVSVGLPFDRSSNRDRGR